MWPRPRRRPEEIPRTTTAGGGNTRRFFHVAPRCDQSVFQRSGDRFASRKRVKTRIQSPVPIPSEPETALARKELTRRAVPLYARGSLTRRRPREDPPDADRYRRRLYSA